MLVLDMNATVTETNENSVTTHDETKSPEKEVDEVEIETDPIFPADHNRQNTDILIDLNDKNFFMYNDKPVGIDDWSEAVEGWKQLLPYPKYVAPSKKRKPFENTELHGVVRCVNDDDSDHLLKSWRAAVEPLTFRYIPNNAYYRLIKFSQSEEDWYTIRKSVPEKVTLSEQIVSARDNRESRSKKRVLRRKSEVRSRSTNSDGALTGRTPKITNIYGHEKTLMSKSVTDLLMENLDSRLHQVENQVKRNMQCKNLGDSQPGFEKETNVLYCKAKQNNVTFNNNVESVDTSYETGSVTSSSTSSTISRNLRPLEKVTPKQRIKIGINNRSLSKLNEPKCLIDTTYLNFGSSIAIEGVDSKPLRSLDNSDKYDSFLLGKGKKTVVSSKNSPSSSPLKKKGAILKYTTASSYLKSKDKIWEPVAIDNTDIVSGVVGEVPEVSGKQIPVTFTTHRLLR